MNFPFLEAKTRLIRIMGTFDLATGHADTFGELLDSLESELRDVQYMTITLTHEEAQQILDVLWNAFDLQQEEINQHIIKYGEFYRPQRVEFMKKELGSIEQMEETINNKIAQHQLKKRNEHD